MKYFPRCDARAVRSATDGGVRLLLIEDDDDGREVLACVLERRGHRVSMAANGLDGIDEALRSRPEVILIDIGLPDMDGYDVARVLRHTIARSVYLIALTGYGSSEDRARAFDAGFDAHLTKPTDLARLTQLLGGRARLARRTIPAPA